jgi:hypothetical protein
VNDSLPKNVAPNLGPFPPEIAGSRTHNDAPEQRVNRDATR